MNQPKNEKSSYNPKIIYIYIIAFPIILSIGAFTGQYWLFIPALFMLYFIYNHKAKNKKEKAKQEDLLHHAIAAASFIPIFFTIVFLIFFLWSLS